MKKLYQKEWFGIPFKSFSALDSKRIAGGSFYDKFYNEFYRKFNAYADLPSEWKEKKGLIAEFLLGQTEPQTRILSVGCGIGYIENILKNQNRDITVIEPSLRATGFLEQNNELKIYHGYFPGCLPENTERFDLIYFVDTDYVFNQQELAALMKSAYKYCDTLMFFSITGEDSWLSSFKEGLKSVASLLGLYARGQFWGYLRTVKDFCDCFRNSGYLQIKSGYLRKDVYWVKAKTCH